jgi:AraC-like DNA-binding protein
MYLGGDFMRTYKRYVIENKGYKTLNVLTLGWEKCTPRYQFSYSYTDFYLIHYVIKGHGTFIKNGVPKTVSAGQMFIIKPGNMYTYIADKQEPWEYIWFSFDGELASIFDEIDDIRNVDGKIIIEMLQADVLQHTRTEFLTGKLFEFVSELFEDAPQENNYVKTAADYIKSNYMYKLCVADIAAELGLNSRYLSRLFKEQKGVTMQEYIIKYKVKRAQVLLSSGLNVGEAARMVGYDDVFTFSKIFKKYSGASPSRFTKS